MPERAHRLVHGRHAHPPDEEVRRGVVADAHREVDEVLDGRGQPRVQVQEHAAAGRAVRVGQHVRLVQPERARLHAAIHLDHQRDLHDARRLEPAVAVVGPSPAIRALEGDADRPERLRAADGLRHLAPVRLHALVSYLPAPCPRRSSSNPANVSLGDVIGWSSLPPLVRRAGRRPGPRSFEPAPARREECGRRAHGRRGRRPAAAASPRTRGRASAGSGYGTGNRCRSPAGDVQAEPTSSTPPPRWAPPDKSARVGMARRGEDRLRRSGLADPAAVEHDHVVGDVAHRRQVVGYEHVGRSGLACSSTSSSRTVA